MEVLKRLRCLALTESTHSLQSELSFGLGNSDSKTIRLFLEQHAVNWVSSVIPPPQRVTVYVTFLSDFVGDGRAVGLFVYFSRPS